MTTNDAGSPSTRTTCDVAVVGYGPVGMTLAALLAQRGVDVLVIERHAQRWALPRAGHLDGETMRTFQGLGIGDAVELVARPMLEWALTRGDHDVLTTIALGESGSGWKADYLSYQPEFEAIIDARARHLGVRVFQGTTAVTLEQNEHRVLLGVRPTDTPDAGLRTVEASFVVGADGAGSFVADALGVRRHDLGFSARPQLVVDFEHHDPDRDLPALQEVCQVLDIRRPHLAGRWSGGRWSRWEFAALAHESREDLEDEAACWGLLRAWGITPEDGRIVRRTVYEFDSLLADHWRSGRVLLAGDAAHTMPPFLGQGMCSGVRDAVNLTWKLAAVLSGDAGQSLLDTYESERMPHVKAMIEMSMAVGDMVLLTDPEAAARRDELLRTEGGPLPPLFPRLGPGLVRRAEQPAASDVDGRPARQGRVVWQGRLALFDDQFPLSGWRLVSRHRVPLDIFDERQRAALTAVGVEFAHISRAAGDDHFVDLDGDYDLWFRETGRKAFLCRPDNYVFGSAATFGELPALIDELAEVLSRYGWDAPSGESGRRSAAAQVVAKAPGR
ncbi:bifunctional 3-(3-hydroxy-phenyl)propionate/3-hydroxycinnamic acid hydroxylase [Amycolatopsis sp. NBC_00345]|uniref:bifunctional 3-(3-hydroxy-phenyl)propionate/3-hydroxycinnamic acid hydroxylase n=1 Tax=Amycolatopsis sp. NBC_00345 TaxID=2975955 RepID=UPI002E26D096